MMLQKIILQSKKKSSDQGFLTIEVILATLVAFFFLMFSLQALATAMFMKVQAQQDQRAEQLIQEDIEAFSSLGSTLSNTIDCNPATYNDNGYAQALWAAFPDVGNTVTTSLLNDGEGQAILSLSRTHVSLNDSTAPHRTLKVFYQVTSSDDATIGNADDEIVATRYVEIIPDDALRCP
ncbi:MAG: hypothetical protein AAGA80_15970 [Cyanobacteria bacterium P01_F01_bin.143]